jgi:hypothetical protein
LSASMISLKIIGTCTFNSYIHKDNHRFTINQFPQLFPPDNHLLTFPPARRPKAPRTRIFVLLASGSHPRGHRFPARFLTMRQSAFRCSAFVLCAASPPRSTAVFVVDG